jgi:hypothetical protein
MKTKNFQTFAGQNDHVAVKPHFRTTLFLAFIRNLCQNYHLLENTSKLISPIRVKICEEQPIYNYKRSSYGHRITTEPRRIDIVAHVAPQDNSVRLDECLLIGFEIKTNLRDLVSDKKFIEYCHAVNMLFLAVPKSLVDYALEKVADRTDVGVYCFEDGHQYKWPEIRYPYQDHINQLRRDAFFRVNGISEIMEIKR